MPTVLNNTKDNPLQTNIITKYTLKICSVKPDMYLIRWKSDSVRISLDSHCELWSKFRWAGSSPQERLKTEYWKCLESALTAQTPKFNMPLLFSPNICVWRIQIYKLDTFLTHSFTAPHFSSSSPATRSSKKEVRQEVTIIIGAQRSNTDHRSGHVCCGQLRSFLVYGYYTVSIT